MNKIPDIQLAASGRHSSRVCARCKKRKTKCDSAWPSCSACNKAGAVCRGYGSGGEDLPRSLVRALEDHVAQLEREAAELQHSPDSVAVALVSRLAYAILSPDSASSSPFFLSTLSPALFLRPSCPPLSISRIKSTVLEPPSDYRQVQTPPRDGPSISTNLSRIPPAALEQMIWNYTNIHLPQYPCVQEKWLRPIFVRMLEYGGDTDAALALGIPPESGLSHFDYFAAFIALAISSITLTWKNETQARTASDAFFAISLQHLRLIAGATEVQRLQISLLLAHYAHMSPAKVDNWACIWNGSRVVLELGLHKSSSEKPSQEQAGLRNQLFWVLYGMERSLCTLLRLPLTFSEESITASLHFPDLNSIGNDETKKQSSASHLYRLRALETEVYRVLYLQDTQAQGEFTDLDSWIESITSRLDEWLETAKGFSRFQIFEFKMVQHSCVKARIYRPTPRLEARTPQSRQACFDACSAVVEDYQQQANRRRLFYPWHAVHILYESAIVMLEACWALRDHIPSRQQARHILAVTVPDCLMLLSKVGESWADAGICVKYLTPIVNEVTVAFRDKIIAGVSSPSKASEAETTEKLRKLLFPEGPPAWGTPLAAESVTTEAEFSASLPDNTTNSSGMEEFDWPAEGWNFLQDLSPVFTKDSPWTG